MAYTTIDDPTIYFNTKLYTGNATDDTTISGVGFQSDWTWIKSRSDASWHQVTDSVRGAGNVISTNSNGAESNFSSLKSFNSDGFVLSDNSNFNGNGVTFASWNWKAGGSAPAITYSVKVVSDSGNKYRFDDFGTSAVTLDLQEGGTYTFDQSDSSNSGHPLRFSTTSNGTHGGGSEYTTGVTTTGTPGNAGAKTVITVGSGVATLYYYCTQHSAMGGQANTNSTFGSSNFSGSIQSTVSAGIPQGFSIITYNGTGSTGTIGHGLNSAPELVILRNRAVSSSWWTWGELIGNVNILELQSNAAKANPNGNYHNDTMPTSSVISIGSDGQVSGNGQSHICYAFHSVKGYCKVGTYTGNGNADGTFVYTGFKPAMVIIKNTASSEHWRIYDNKRDSFNHMFRCIFPNESSAESTVDNASEEIDFLSGGIKIRSNAQQLNASGQVYIYMAFAESPFVNSKGVPNNAR